MFCSKLEDYRDTFLVTTRVCAFVEYHAVRKTRKIMLNRVLLLRPIKQLQPRLTLTYLGAVYLRKRRNMCDRASFALRMSVDFEIFRVNITRHRHSENICKGKFEVNE